MTDGFLGKVYDLDGLDATRALYDAWSASYESEVAENGYVTPGRVAKALRKFVPDASTPVLDYGCGTGLSGLALKVAGFTTIDGVDISPEMLAQAATKNLYRNLHNIEGETPLAKGNYQTITAIGVIGAGAAPASVFDTVMDLLPSGGHFAFSFNDHTLQDPMYEGKLSEYLDTGSARLLLREHGDHFTAMNMKSTVYVIVKK